jgi:hypothetical protein
MDFQAAASKQHGIGHGAAIMRHLKILTVLADQPPGPQSSQTVSNPGTLVEPQATDLFHWQGHALVVGAGVVGLLTAFLLAQIPGLEVVVTDRDLSRAAIAEAMGARFAAPDAVPGERELIIHASASEAGSSCMGDPVPPPAPTPPTVVGRPVA